MGVPKILPYHELEVTVQPEILLLLFIFSVENLISAYPLETARSLEK